MLWCCCQSGTPGEVVAQGYDCCRWPAAGQFPSEIVPGLEWSGPGANAAALFLGVTRESVSSALLRWTCPATPLGLIWPPWIPNPPALKAKARIRGVDVDHIGALYEWPQQFVAAPVTTAETYIEYENREYTEGQAVEIDITGVVQEIMGRSGWQSGNGLMLLFFGESDFVSVSPFWSIQASIPCQSIDGNNAYVPGYLRLVLA